jgi:8-oxo-dGTP diphosphatase
MDLQQPDRSASHSHPVVAVAILHREGQFLMQLRDDDPTIMYPGHWAFFGGHLEPGESPEVGVRRELLEEIGYCPVELALFDSWTDGQVTRHVYHGILGAELDDLVLTEGMDMQLLNLEDIQRGDRYSPQIQQVRPLGPPHQRILLNFVKSREVG